MMREKSASFPEFEIWRNLSEGRISYPQTNPIHGQMVIDEKKILELWASGVSEDILGQASCFNFASLRRYDDSNMPLITEIQRWFWTNSPLTFYGEFSDFVLVWGDLPKFYKSHNIDCDIFGKPAKIPTFWCIICGSWVKIEQVARSCSDMKRRLQDLQWHTGSQVHSNHNNACILWKITKMKLKTWRGIRWKR